MKALALEAIKWYDRTQHRGALADALLRCFLFGIVVDRPNLLILAEPCFTDGKAILSSTEKPNCWWIHFAAHPTGEISYYDMLNEGPYPLEYVAFRRRTKTIIHTWEQLRRDIYGRSTNCPSTAAA